MSEIERKMMDCTEVHLDLGKLTEEQREKMAEIFANQRCVVEHDPHPTEVLRPCTGAYWDNGKRHDVVGRFHGWGSDYEEFCDAGPGNFTVAIIEEEDGKIAVCNANTVRFLDRGSKNAEGR